MILKATTGEGGRRGRRRAAQLLRRPGSSRLSPTRTPRTPTRTPLSMLLRVTACCEVAREPLAVRQCHLCRRTNTRTSRPAIATDQRPLVGDRPRTCAQPIRRRCRTRTHMLERVSRTPPHLPGKSTATVAPTTGQWPLTRTAVSPDLGARPVLPPLSGWQGVCRPHMDPVSRLDHGA